MAHPIFNIISEQPEYPHVAN